MAQDFCTELYLEMRFLSTICKKFFKGDNSAISCFEFCFGLHVIAVRLCLCVSVSLSLVKVGFLTPSLSFYGLKRSVD